MSVTKIVGLAATAVPALVCLVLALNGCNKSSSVTAENRVLHVELDDYFLSPQEILVTRSGPLRIVVHNKGSVPHSFRIRRRGRDIGGSGALAAGQSATTKVQLNRGTYRVFSGLANDETLGLYGSLTVAK